MSPAFFCLNMLESYFSNHNCLLILFRIPPTISLVTLERGGIQREERKEAKPKAIWEGELDII